MDQQKSKTSSQKRVGFFFLGLFLAVTTTSCSSGSAKYHFLQGEKFWFEKKYAPAVTEFERAAEKDPKGNLGQYARYRAAEVRWLYLYEDIEAIQNFQAFLKESKNQELNWQASLQVGEILYSRLQAYEQALIHYSELVKHPVQDPKELPEIYFRMAKCQFYLWNFDEAKELFESVIKKFPNTSWAERAAYEVGVSNWMLAERVSSEEPAEAKEVWTEAQKSFQEFIAKYPQSKWMPLARYGLASILESNDKEADAVKTLQYLATEYPSPRIIQLKLARIFGRQKKRGVLQSDEKNSGKSREK